MKTGQTLSHTIRELSIRGFLMYVRSRDAADRVDSQRAATALNVRLTEAMDGALEAYLDRCAAGQNEKADDEFEARIKWAGYEAARDVLSIDVEVTA